MKKKQSAPFSDAFNRQILMALPDGVAITDLERRNIELAAINLLSRKVSESLTLEEVISAAIEGLKQTLKADVSFVFLREGDKLILKGVDSEESKKLLGDVPEHKVGECMCGLAVTNKTAMYSVNIFNDARCTWEECKKAGLKSFAALPLFSGDEIIGVVGLSSKAERNFETESAFLETLSKTISIGLSNALLYTKTKQIELSLTESEKKYRTLVDQSPDGIFIVDLKGKFLSVNREMIQKLKFSEDEFLSMNIWDIIPKDFLTLHEKRLQRILSGESLIEPAEYLIKGKDEQELFIEILSAPYIEKNKIIGFQGIAHDITERKKHEAELKERLLELGTVHEASQRLQALIPTEKLAGEIIAILEKNLAYNYAAVLLVEPSTGKLLPFAVSDQGKGEAFSEKDKAYIRSHNVRVGEGITGMVASTGMSYLSGDVTGDPRYKPVREDVRSELCVPLRIRDEVIGIINIETDQPDAYDFSEQRVLETIAAQISVAIQNSRLLEQVRDAEEKFSKTFHLSPDIIILTSAKDGLIVDVNDNVLLLTGFKPEEFIGNKTTDLSIWVELAVREHYMSTLLTKGKLQNLETEFQMKTGEVRTGLISGEIIEIGGEQFILSVIRDITERKQLEEERRINQERFHSLMEHTDEGFYLLETVNPIPVDTPIEKQIQLIYSSTIIECNNAQARMYGYSNAEELLRKSLAEFHGGTDDPENISFLRRWIEGGHRITGAISFEIDRAGNHVWFSNNIVGIIEDDMLIRIWGTQTNITEMKRAEEALRVSEERWQFALEGAGDGVWDWDTQTNTVFFSTQWKAQLGYNDDEIGGTFDEWYNRVHPDDFALVNDEINKHFAGVTPLYQSEHRLRCKDQTYKWILDRGKVISWDKDGKPLRVIGTHTDITHRKQAQELLRATMNRLIETEEALKRIAAQQLHDQVGQNLTALSLNLTFVQSQVQEMKRVTLDKRLTDSIHLIEETMEQTRNIMTDLKPPALDDFGLHAALHWSIARFTERTSIPVEYSGRDLTRRLQLNVEYALFRMVQEVLHNVVKHARASMVRVVLLENGDLVRLSIHDNGIGFDSGRVAGRKKVDEFGLTSIDERMKALGGSFRIDSTPGKGTTIILEIKNKPA